MKTVFILGAGASRAAGGPLMHDFIDVAGKLHRRRESLWAHEHFENVMSARRKLQVAFAKSNIDLDNIENLFSTFEMASLIGRLADLEQEVVSNLPVSLRFLIMRTLEQSILFPIDGVNGIVPAPYPYDAFVQLLIELGKMPEVAPISVINFNYDLCLDYAIAVANQKCYYGLAGENDKKGSIHHYKVHGSLNWFRNEATSNIYAVEVNPLPMESYLKRLGIGRAAESSIDTMEVIYGPDKWGEAINPEPIIVPPTWNKGWYQQQLKSVWCAASVALSSAENIYVIGYSLPSSDQFFRSFYSLSTISESIIEKFWLFDPANKQEMIDRFTSLLGPAITSRNRFSYEPLKFSGAIKHIAEYYNLVTNGLVDR